MVYEVSLSLQRLTKKYGADLGPAEWEEIINILSVIDRHIQVVGGCVCVPMGVTRGSVGMSACQWVCLEG